MNIDARLDPEIRETLAAFPFTPINGNGLEKRRAEFNAMLDASLLTTNVERRTVSVPGLDGAPEINVRIHRAVDAVGDLPCLFWMHGGGLVVGNEEQDDLRFDSWCVRHNIMAVSVNYRLAPETKYPGAIHDCYAALLWVHINAASLGIDSSNIGIGGASAGAGLAAALSLVVRDRGLPNNGTISSQLLIYPMLDDRQQTVSSNWDVPIWPPSSNRFGWDAYLGDLAGENVPAYAAAARATDLSNLPPTLITVGALDGFVDEDIDYALRLNRAGVPVELHVYPGAAHGFESITPKAAVSKQATADIHAWIKKHYAHR
jgi:acetyl esterase/lipase